MTQGQCKGSQQVKWFNENKAGFAEKRRLYTNQSARKTMIQKLNVNKSSSFPVAVHSVEQCFTEDSSA